jgi:hypothetical protein
MVTAGKPPLATQPVPELAGLIAVIVPVALTVTVNGPGAVVQTMLLSVTVVVAAT